MASLISRNPHLTDDSNSDLFVNIIFAIQKWPYEIKHNHYLKVEKEFLCYLTSTIKVIPESLLIFIFTFPVINLSNGSCYIICHYI